VLKAWLLAYKNKYPCKCGEGDPACLDFHHVDGKKEINVSLVTKRAWSIERLKAEVAKCVILCANCHRKEHAKLRALT
jgi:hypothetical protein